MKKATLHRIPTLLLLLVALAGCKLMDDPIEDEAAEGWNGASAGDENTTPSIWGDPATTVPANTQYQFTPEADDADGDVLEYVVVNKPEWAEFDIYSGSLRGVPNGDDVGTHRNIVISVTDGNSVVSLPSFGIDVQGAAGGSGGDDGGSSGDDDGTGDSDDDGSGGTDGGDDGGDEGAGGTTDDDGDTGDTGDSGGSGEEDDGGADEDPPAESSPPSISGSPNESVVVDALYWFQPEADDPDGDALSFSIVNRPSWATFDTTTGELRGRPDAGDIGTTEGIEISVTDGTGIAALNTFGITVEPVPTASYTVSWIPPTENVDGTPLTDLVGYRIYYGTSSGNYSETIEIAAGMTSYMIDDLTPGTYYLAMTSINSLDMESKKTPELEFQP